MLWKTSGLGRENGLSLVVGSSQLSAVVRQLTKGWMEDDTQAIHPSLLWRSAYLPPSLGYCADTLQTGCMVVPQLGHLSKSPAKSTLPCGDLHILRRPDPHVTAPGFDRDCNLPGRRPESLFRRRTPIYLAATIFPSCLGRPMSLISVVVLC
jgi:hypothetical protein